MFAKWIGRIGAALCIMTAAPVCLAATVTYGFERLTANSTVNTAPYYQMDVSEVPGDSTRVDFTFRNLADNPATSSSIKAVYFDDGALLSIAQIIPGPGVSFATSGGSNLPNGNTMTPPFETTAGFYATTSGGDANGVKPGEYLTIRFNLVSGKLFEDVIGFLAAGLTLTPPAPYPDSLRVGIHVGSLPEKSDGTGVQQSDSFFNTSAFPSEPTVIPLPAAAWAGLALFGLMLAGRMSRRLRSAA
jgi:hypothetical protein